MDTEAAREMHARDIREIRNKQWRDMLSTFRFEYGSGWGSTTFNSEWNKGFIHNGVEARITYVGKEIIKVEVK